MYLAARKPAPFTELDHVFASLEDLCTWLCQPQMKTNNRAWRRLEAVSIPFRMESGHEMLLRVHRWFRGGACILGHRLPDRTPDQA